MVVNKVLRKKFMCVNKKGFLKTLEAVIAIIIAVTAVYLIMPKGIEPTPDPPLVVKSAQDSIVGSISNNDDLRVKILGLQDDPTLPGEPQKIEEVQNEVQHAIQEYMPPNYDFRCAVCRKTDHCILSTPLSKVAYMSDVFIASSLSLELENQYPKIIRFWMWPKPTKEEDLPPTQVNACEVISL